MGWGDKKCSGASCGQVPRSVPLFAVLHSHLILSSPPEEAVFSLELSDPEDAALDVTPVGSIGDNEVALGVAASMGRTISLPVIADAAAASLTEDWRGSASASAFHPFSDTDITPITRCVAWRRSAQRRVAWRPIVLFSRDHVTSFGPGKGLRAKRPKMFFVSRDRTTKHCPRPRTHACQPSGAPIAPQRTNFLDQFSVQSDHALRVPRATPSSRRRSMTSCRRRSSPPTTSTLMTSSGCGGNSRRNPRRLRRRRPSKRRTRVKPAVKVSPGCVVCVADMDAAPRFSCVSSVQVPLRTCLCVLVSVSACARPKPEAEAEREFTTPMYVCVYLCVRASETEMGEEETTPHVRVCFCVCVQIRKTRRRSRRCTCVCVSVCTCV